MPPNCVGPVRERHGIRSGALTVVLTVALSGLAAAQATAPKADSATTVTAVPRAQRPVVVVMPFEFAAVLETSDASAFASLWAMPGGAKSAQQSSGENAGRAVAGLLIERLLASGNFRVVERAALDAVKTEQDLARGGRPAPDSAGQARGLVGAKYVVTGQITKFGKAKREKGGGIVGMITERVGGFGLGSNETSYEVSLTGRVVEAATGELVTSMTTDGVVIGDNGLVIVGGGASVGGGAVGGFGSQATGEREKRIAEALRSAVDKLVLQLVRARERGDIEP